MNVYELEIHITQSLWWKTWKNYWHHYIFAKGRRNLFTWCVKYTLVNVIRNSYFNNKNTKANSKSIYTILWLRRFRAGDIVGMLRASQHATSPCLWSSFQGKSKLRLISSVNIFQVQKLKTPTAFLSSFFFWSGIYIFQIAKWFTNETHQILRQLTKNMILPKNMIQQYTLRKKCPYLELFWSAFSHIRTEYGEKNREYLTGKMRTRITPNTDTFYAVIKNPRITSIFLKDMLNEWDYQRNEQNFI